MDAKFTMEQEQPEVMELKSSQDKEDGEMEEEEEEGGEQSAAAGRSVTKLI